MKEVVAVRKKEGFSFVLSLQNLDNQLDCTELDI